MKKHHFDRSLAKRIISLLFVGIALMCSLYLLFATLGSSIPVNADRVEGREDTITIYLITNRYHIDLSVPLRTCGYDWSRLIDPGQTRLKMAAGQYISFGWGDSAFFRQTPTWDELRPGPAIRAISGCGSPALHVSFHPAPIEGEHCKKIRISKQEFLMLVAYISGFIKKDGAGKCCYIPDAGYSFNDLLCESTGNYSLFFNCNSWTNECLQVMDCKACLWTPFEYGIMRQYQGY
jgi:uncharacterized protein (TIGR02117 family)